MADNQIEVDITGNTSDFDKAVEGMSGKVSASTIAMGNLLSDMGKKALSGFGNMIASGDQFNQAINQMAASTGAAGAELEGLRDVVKDVYSNNFGESYEDAANAVAEVSKQTGLMGEELQKATESAFALSDTFEMDVQESTKAAKSMMSNFGISAEEAYNLIAVGAQNGADSSGELIDTLNEYAADVAEAGLSAEQFTSALVAGSDAGVYSVDKIGDAIREMNTTAKDGTAAEAFEALGFNADEMAAKFAAGGDTAKAAFEETITALNNTTDPLVRNSAAVGLMGSIYEDTGDGIITALSAVADTSVTAVDALGQINEAKYDDVGSAVEGLKRTIGKATIDIRSDLSGGLTDAISGFVNVLNSADGDAGKIFDGLVEAAKTALSAVAPVIENWIDKGKEIIEKIVSGIQENLPVIKQKAQDILQMLIKGIAGKANMIVEVGLPLLQSLIQGISENAGSLLEAGKTLLGGIVTAIQAALPNLLPLTVQIITELINGLANALVMLMQFVPQILLTIIEIIVGNLPMLITAAIEILNALIGGLIDNVGTLLAAVVYILMTLADLIIQNLPLLLDAAIQILMAVVNGLIGNLPMLIEAAIEMVYTLVNGLIAMLPELIEAAIQIITALFDGLVENLPKLIEAGIKLIVALISGLIQAIPDLLKAIPQIISAIWDALMGVDWLQLGMDILSGIGNGLLEGVTGLLATVGEVCTDLWDGFKDFFGIHSPSKLMRDSIGAYLLPGVAVGMEDTTGETADDLNRSLDEVMNSIDMDALQMQMDAAVQMQGYSSVMPTFAGDSYGSDDGTYTPDAEPPGMGDIIIPVNIGGQQLEAIVIKAAQIANARSGGVTI